MLTSVPNAVNRLTRNVVINHPNSLECQVFRKVITRESSTGERMGGLLTVGGLGVLDSEDEESIEFNHLGNGYALRADAFSASLMMDRRDANNGFGDELRFLIEPEAPSGMEGYFDIRKGDVFYVVLTDTVKLAYEIVGTETVSDIPPFVTRYIANRRADIDLNDGPFSGFGVGP